MSDSMEMSYDEQKFLDHLFGFPKFHKLKKESINQLFRFEKHKYIICFGCCDNASHFFVAAGPNIWELPGMDEYYDLANELVDRFGWKPLDSGEARV